MFGTAFTEETLRAVFLELDTSGDGFLSHAELFDGLLRSDLDWNASYEKREVLDRLWKKADADGNGQVSFAEFWKLVAATRSPTEEELARAYGHFKAIDASGDGVLDRLEIQEALENPNVDWEALGVDRSVSDRQIYDMLDENGDQRVSFDEFWRFILNATRQREDAMRETETAMASVSAFAGWTPRQVGDWLETIGFGRYRPSFEANGVDGGKLNALTFDSLPKLMVQQFDHCKGIMRAIRALKGREPGEMETREDLLAKGRLAAAATDAAEAEDDGVALEGKRRCRFGDARAFEDEEARLNALYAKPKTVMKCVV
jgi:Ca2+-binding EF-hand superfamily protein